LLHELAVDGPGSFELLGCAAELVFGLEELLFELAGPLSEAGAGELGDHLVGQEVVGDEAGAFCLGEAALQGPELGSEAAVLSPAVLQLGTQGGAGELC
jgi:hypothetical protein